MIESISIKLGMSENELTACIGKTILSTARQIISKNYPDPVTTFANVDREHVRTVAGKCSFIAFSLIYNYSLFTRVCLVNAPNREGAE